MRTIFLYTVLFASVLETSAQSTKLPVPSKIKPISSISVQVDEPSDAALSPDGQSFYVVSDNGYLAQIDKSGKLLRKADVKGIDFEGIYVNDTAIFLMDETPRKVYQLDLKTLEVKRTYLIPYTGGRNKGFESLTWNNTKGVFVTFTEKDPIWIYELDKDFRVVNQLEFNKKVRDVSSIRWHGGFMWILSDEDRTLHKCDPKTYAVLESWLLPVINPEGFVFADGKLYVFSDDMERMYIFDWQEAVK